MILLGFQVKVLWRTSGSGMGRQEIRILQTHFWVQISWMWCGENGAVGITLEKATLSSIQPCRKEVDSFWGCRHWVQGSPENQSETNSAVLKISSDINTLYSNSKRMEASSQYLQYLSALLWLSTNYSYFKVPSVKQSQLPPIFLHQALWILKSGWSTTTIIFPIQYLFQEFLSPKAFQNKLLCLYLGFEADTCQMRINLQTEKKSLLRSPGLIENDSFSES